MNIALFLVGLVITLIVIYDMVYTILSPRGAGLIADRVSRNLWRGYLELVGGNGKNRSLRFIGPLLLLIIVLVWIILLWIGNTIMIYSDGQALWSGTSREYVPGFIEKLYFTAYVLSSMGSGDYTPASDLWMLYTGFISYTGVVFISLGISFLIPVIEAITLKRQVSLQLHNLGPNPRSILENYSENGYMELMEKLDSLEPSILKLAQYHLAYPVIHYFHSERRYECLPVMLASLDEALSILMYKVDKDSINNIMSLRTAYNALTYYHSTLANAFITPGDDEPEHPDTSYLTQISKKDSIHGERSGSDLVHRRKLLLAYLQNDGWEWDDMAKYGEAVSLKN